MLNTHKFNRLSFAALAYTIIVILWGAFVRISKSGDGCGDSWPLCNEQLIPSAASLPTWIEFTHRLTSGLFLIFIVVLVICAYRWYPKRHWLRRWVWLVMAFTISEALVGAVLVLKGLVGDNTSVFRAYVMGIHMLNSLALVAAIAVCVIGASGGWVRRTSGGVATRTLPVLLLGFMLIASTGALAALAGTLFPSESLFEGLVKDFSAESHWLVRLRIWHPMAATLVGGGIFVFALTQSFETDDRRLRNEARLLLVSVLVALLFGYFTLFSLSPTWMKLVHLLLAHGLWLILIRFSWNLYFCRKWRHALSL